MYISWTQLLEVGKELAPIWDRDLLVLSVVEITLFTDFNPRKDGWHHEQMQSLNLPHRSPPSVPYLISQHTHGGCISAYLRTCWRLLLESYRTIRGCSKDHHCHLRDCRRFYVSLTQPWFCLDHPISRSCFSAVNGTFTHALLNRCSLEFYFYLSR